MNIYKNTFSRKKCSLFREKGTPVQETQKCRACTYSYSNGTDILLGVKSKAWKLCTTERP